MKTTIPLLILFLVLSNNNCSSQQKERINKNNSTKIQKTKKIEKIEVTEQTRGTNRVITFTPNSKIVSLNGNATTSALSSGEWENIVTQSSIIDLSKISSLEAPSTNRFSDRALSSHISITADGKTYQSVTFDAGAPPKELESLYKALMINTQNNQKPPRKNIR